MMTLNCACDPCVTSYYRISTESHDFCNLIGSANIPAEPTETCSESADPLSLSPSSPCISLVPSKVRSECLPRETKSDSACWARNGSTKTLLQTYHKWFWTSDISATAREQKVPNYHVHWPTSVNMMSSLCSEEEIGEEVSHDSTQLSLWSSSIWRDVRTFRYSGSRSQAKPHLLHVYTSHYHRNRAEAIAS